LSDRLAALSARLRLSEEETLASSSSTRSRRSRPVRPPAEVEILDSMTADAAERAGAGALAAWLRSTGDSPTPLDCSNAASSPLSRRARALVARQRRIGD